MESVQHQHARFRALGVQVRKERGERGVYSLFRRVGPRPYARAPYGQHVSYSRALALLKTVSAWVENRRQKGGGQ